MNCLMIITSFLFLLVSGNACEEEIPDLIEYDLVPTTGSLEFLQEWALQARNNCPEYILSSRCEVR